MSGGVWHRTLAYLGLKEEPEDTYDELHEHLALDDVADVREPHAAARPVRGPGAGRDNVHQLHTGEVQVIRSASGAASAPPLRTPVVEVEVFDDVEAVGARYRAGQQVVFDVGRADRTTARRVVDFVSGLTYIAHGRLTRVGERAFLLLPEGVTLPAEEVERLADLGYDAAEAGR